MLKLENITKQTERAKKFFEDKVAFTVGPLELKEIIDTNRDNIEVIDTRSRESYEKGHIPFALSIPGKDISMHMNRLSKDKINIVYCYSEQCHLGAKTAVILAENGYPVIELQGGFNEWKNYDYDIVS